MSKISHGDVTGAPLSMLQSVDSLGTPHSDVFTHQNHSTTSASARGTAICRSAGGPLLGGCRKSHKKVTQAILKVTRFYTFFQSKFSSRSLESMYLWF